MPRRTLTALALALAACAAPSDAEPLPPGQAAAPAPAEMELRVTPMVAGAPITLAVLGAPPGVEITLAYALSGLGDGFCPPEFDGRCMGMLPPVTPIRTTRITQPDGTMSMTWIVPPSLEGRYLSFQAATLDPTPRFSNPVAAVVAPAGTPIQPLMDLDGDGWTPIGGDCDDYMAVTHPRAPDVAGDGYDTNCDRADGVDGDRDGVASVASGGSDCDDTRWWIRPDVPDACNGVDDDCDGLVDADAMGARCDLVDRFPVTVPAPADVLFVVHDGPGMAGPQAELGAMAVDLFTMLEQEGVDAHVGVISTDGATPGDAGRLVGLGDARFLPTAYGASIALEARWFEQVTALGTAGGGGEGLRATALAFAEANAQANDLFRRERADLHVVYVSDVDDASAGVPTSALLAQGLDTLVRSPARWQAHALVAPPGGCGQAQEGASYLDLAVTSEGTGWPICDAPYTPFVERLRGQLTEHRLHRTTFTLARPPLPDTVVVTVTPPGAGGAFLPPGGWTLDEDTGVLTITRALPAHATVTVTYDAR